MNKFFQLCLFVLSLTAREALSTGVGIVLSSSSGNASVHSTVLLVCVAGGSLPQPEITWHFSGSPIQTNVSTKHTVYNNPLNLTFGMHFMESILEICDIRFDDGGQYTCNASAQRETANTTINITILEIPIRVNITGKKIFDESETLELNCTSNPSATLSWFKRSDTSAITKLLPSSRISMTFQNDGVEGRFMAYSVLTIRDVARSDNGTYVCVAENNEISLNDATATVNHTVHINAINECRTISGVCQNGGQCTDLERGYSCICTDRYTGTNCEMQVFETEQSKPEIREPPANRTIDVATPVNLTCTATGNPPPNYQWYKDGEPIIGETRSYLYITELLPEERGNYTCVASNSRGSSSKDAKVDLQGILQYTAYINFSNPVVNVDDMLLMIVNTNISTSSVYAVEVLNSSQRQMFTLLITLVNVSISSSAEISTALVNVELSLKYALENLPTAMAQVVQLQRYDGCNPEEFEGRMWPEAAPGFTASNFCPCTEAVGPLPGRATRQCLGTYRDGAEWGNVDYSQCASRLSGQLCLLYENLTEIENAPIPVQINVSQIIKDITSEPETLTDADVSVSASVISQLTTGATMDTQLRDNYLQIIDNIQKVDAATVLASQVKTDSSLMVLRSLQRFQDAYVPINESDTDNKTVFTFNTFALNIQTIDTNNFDGQSFSVNLGSVEDTMNISGTIPEDSLETNDAIMNVSTNATASIQLPEDLFKSCGLSSGSDAQKRLSFSVFLSGVLFQDKNRPNLTVGSIIVAARVQCNNTMTLNTPVTVSFLTNRMTEADASRSSFCGSWSTEGSGAWLTSNCVEKEEIEVPTKAASSSEYEEEEMTNSRKKNKNKELEHEEGENIRVVKYYHLAHFGILFDVMPEPLPRDEAIALHVITYIGLITSILSLVVFLISYFSARNLRTSTHGQILINMCFALMGLYIFFLIGGYATSIKELCGVSSALLQYFLLVFFGWTTVEVVWLYLKLVKVFGIQSLTSKFMLKAGIPTWVVPLLIVAITLGPDHENYYYKLPYCRAIGWSFYAGTIAPFIVIYIVNWIMFIIIMASICKHTKGADHKKGINVDSIKKNIVIALTLATIFGLGWGIGLASTTKLPIKELALAFQIIFSLLVGFQGVLIFLLHGVRNKDVRNLWKQCFARIGGKSLLDNILSMTKTSSAGPQSLRGTTSMSGTMSLSQKKPLGSIDHLYTTVTGEETKTDLTL